MRLKYLINYLCGTLGYKIQKCESNEEITQSSDHKSKLNMYNFLYGAISTIHSHH